MPASLLETVLQQNPDCVYSGSIFVEIVEDTWEESIKGVSLNWIIFGAITKEAMYKGSDFSMVHL